LAAEAEEGAKDAEIAMAKREVKVEEVRKVEAVLETKNNEIKRDPMEGMRVKVQETPSNRPNGIPETKVAI